MVQNRERKEFRKDTGRIFRQVLLYNLIIVSVVVLISLIQTTAFIIQTSGLDPTQADQEAFLEQISSSGLSSMIAVCIGVGIYLFLDRKRKMRMEIFRRGQKKMTGKCFLQIFFVFMMWQLLFSVFTVCGEAFWNQLGYTMESSVEWAGGTSSTITMALYVGLLGPVAEELIYRGFVLRSLERYGKVFAILVSSLLFGFMHGNLAQIPYAIAVGIVLGYVALEYSIEWAIVLHVLNNGVMTAALNRLDRLFPEPAATIISYGILLFFFLAGCMVLGVHRKRLATYLQSDQPAKKYYIWALTNFWFLLFVTLELFSAFTSLERLP